MKFKKTLTRVTALLLIAAAAGVSVSAAPALTSRWKTPDKHIKIDGLIDDWSELLAFDEKIAVAASNDGQHLYLAIAANDLQRRRQLLGGGVIVWLDARGGKKESWGIRIPGSGFQRPEGFGPDAPADTDARAQRRGGRAQPDITYVELLGPGKDDRRRIELAAQPAIAVAAATETDTLLYELKIPLAGDTYAFTATPGRPVGLGIHTPKLERPDRAQRSSGRTGGIGGRGGGSSGRGRGRSGGSQGAGMRGGGPEAMSQLKLWTKLTLAQSPR